MFVCPEKTNETHPAVNVGNLRRNILPRGFIYIQMKSCFLIKITVAQCIRWKLAEMDAIEKKQNTSSLQGQVRADLLSNIVSHSASFSSLLGGIAFGEKWGIKQRNLSRLIEQMKQIF